MAQENQVYQALVDERDRGLKKVERYDKELAVELRILLRMIDRYIPNNRSDKPTDNGIAVAVEKVTVVKMFKPTQVIKRVFEDNPEKEFTPSQLRDILLDFKKRGELLFKGKNILVTTHTVLRVLMNRKDKFIIKIDKADGIPVYQLAAKENGRLL